MKISQDPARSPGQDPSVKIAKAANHSVHYGYENVKSSNFKSISKDEEKNTKSDSRSVADSNQNQSPPKSSSQNNKNDYDTPLQDKGSHILSPMCGGCHHAFRDRRDEHTDCYSFMKRKKNKLKLDSMLDAALVVGGADRDSIASNVRGNIADHVIEGCEVCNLDQCWKRLLPPDHDHSTKNATKKKRYLTKYWRYDETSPKFTNPTTLYLSSIPESLRVPPSRYHDIENYLMEIYKNETIIEIPTNNDKNNNHGEAMLVPILMEYNPGLAPIPDKMKYPIGTLPTEATYLVSLRVTPANNCFPREVYKNIPKELNEAVYHTTTNHLGLALLDENYIMIPGYDAVIDMDVQLGVKRKVRVNEGEVKGLTGEPAFMDYRLFTLGDDIYLHANADLVVVSTLDLATRGSDNKSGRDEEEKKNEENEENSNKSEDTDDMKSSNTDAETDEKDEDRPFVLKNLYGGGKLQVTLQHPFNTIWSGGSKGKNYALFTIPTNDLLKTSSDSNHAGNYSLPIFAEIEINSPHHKVQQIIPSQYQKISRKITNVRQRRNPRLDPMMKRSMLTVGDVHESNSTLPLPSFFNVDEVWFPGKFAFKDFNHGGACCISFSAEELLGDSIMQHNHRDGLSEYPWGNHPSLHVGIAHTHVQWKRWYMDKTKEKEVELLPHTHYVSLIYAFDPFPPFEIRARSGYFCLGFANPVDPTHANGSAEPERGTFNPHTPLTRNRKLRQNNETFECPQMQYVSSFIQKVGDPSKTVIGYGLNDCTPRLVEVAKSEIGRLLFPDVWEMVLEDESQ